MGRVDWSMTADGGVRDTPTNITISRPFICEMWIDFWSASFTNSLLLVPFRSAISIGSTMLVVSNIVVNCAVGGVPDTAPT